MSISIEIKKKAIEIGFDKVGISKVDLLKNEEEKLSEWLNKKFHGTMSWMEKNFEKRIDVSNVLPNAKSIVSVALNYQTDICHSQNKNFGKISRYAFGNDYHDILKNKLEILLNFVKEKFPNTNSKIYVDTGPVLEKVWAVKSGIGWMGKHTNVIAKELGSYFFIGEIILDIELESDKVELDLCGTCTKCIDDCPTDAIIAPYILDSNKCISYLTIEHKDEIEKKFIGKFKSWIYGCDICQEVCPWNKKFSHPTNELSFYGKNIELNLDTIENLTDEDFQKQFKKSAIKRIKNKQLKRNGKFLNTKN